MEDRCACCGNVVPEGRQVCWNCENNVFVSKKDLHDCNIPQQEPINNDGSLDQCKNQIGE